MVTNKVALVSVHSKNKVENSKANMSGDNVGVAQLRVGPLEATKREERGLRCPHN